MGQACMIYCVVEHMLASRHIDMGSRRKDLRGCAYRASALQCVVSIIDSSLAKDRPSIGEEVGE